MEHSDHSLKDPDLATTKVLACFLRIDRTAVTEVMKVMGVPKRGAGYPWIRILVAFGIDVSAIEDLETLKAPLLELKDVAALLGESPKTTRRRGDGKHRDKTIPNHIDLGPRKRLYFPGEIQSWILGEPVPFERNQENLSFIPSKQKKSGPPQKYHKEARVAQPSQVSAAALFMVPPNSVGTKTEFLDLIHETYLLSASGLDLSRICAAPGARFGHFPFEGDRAFPAQS